MKLTWAALWIFDEPCGGVMERAFDNNQPVYFLTEKEAVQYES